MVAKPKAVAAKKTAVAKLPAIVPAASIEPAADMWISPTEAMKRVFANPAKIPNFGFAVVRRTYAGYANTAPDYARAKLQPRRPEAAGVIADGDWPVTAAEHDLLLPSGVSDDYRRPGLLFARYQQGLLADRPELLLSLTLHFERPLPRHDMMEAGRAFAMEHLVRKRRLSTLLVLHLPGEVASENRPHIHLLSLARQHWPSGWGSYATDILCDDGQHILYAEWSRFWADWDG